MRRSLFALSSMLVIAGCVQPSARLCTTDEQCDAEACLEGRCAPALQDPGGTAISPGGPLRVLSVGLHPTLDDVVTQSAWRSFVRARFERDVVARLATDRPNLIVLPASTTLTTTFIGARGEAARALADSSAALASVLEAQRASVDHYAAIAAPDLPPARLRALAVTDTVWRAIEPFRELAREHEIWIALTGDFADAERTTDAAIIAAVADEAEPDRSFAWVATSDDVFEQTFVIDPEGALVHAFRKSYVEPSEAPGPDLERRDLDPGAPEDVRAHDLPFARIASLIGDDARMPDVLDRLALDGAAMILHPEAIGGWAVLGDDGAWPPDVARQSGWAHVQRYPELQASVLACWSGNLFERVLDCQSSILAQSRHDTTRGAWIGQDDEIGHARVAPWAIADDRAGTLSERRARLITHGERLAPGSGDPLENSYADGTVHLDLDLSSTWPVRVADPGEIVIAPSDSGEQRRPTIARTSDGVAVLWEDTRRGQTRIYGARAELAGDSLAIAEARMRIVTEGEPRRVRTASAGDEIHAVWQERRGDDDAMYSVSVDGGRSFGTAIALGGTAATTAAQWTPDIALGSSGVWATWIDRRGVGARVYASRITSGSPEGQPIVPLEGAYSPRANQHSPSIAMVADSPVLVWADFAASRWEIHGARYNSVDSGFLAYRIDDAAAESETLHSDPRVAQTSSGPLAVWTDLRTRDANYDVRVARANSIGVSASPATTDGAARPQWRPAVAAIGARVILVWQDTRGDHQSLRFAVSFDAGATFSPDAPLLPTDDGVSRYNPEVVLLDQSHAVVAYETTASGARRVALRVLVL